MTLEEMVNEDIEVAAAERQHHWSKPWESWSYELPHRVNQLTKDLDGLYALKRQARAVGRTGAKARSAV